MGIALPAVSFLSVSFCSPAAASASSLAQVTGWRRYWLPENLSEHGGKMDLQFNVMFALTGIVFIGVFYALIKFCWKYRYRKNVSKAHFSHGNKKLELIWTIIPAIILLALALWTKVIWDDYRYSPTAQDPKLAKILVIGEQFKWNVVYPGPDKKLGRYLIYPKTTDAKWPVGPDGTASHIESEYGGLTEFQEKPFPPGPAFLPPAVSKRLLNSYISGVNPLGKDFSDEAGKDDDWNLALGRPVYVPRGRPVEIHLSSKDVLHDFFLPDYRVKLDAVPGLRGLIYFTATKSSAEFEKASQKTYDYDELTKLIGVTINPPDVRIIVPQAQAADYTYTAESEVTKTIRGKKQRVIEKTDVQINDGDPITLEMLKGLQEKGVVKKIEAFTAKSWDVVCEELCGSGHGSMRGSLIVLEPEEFTKRFETKAEAPAAQLDVPVKVAAK